MSTLHHEEILEDCLFEAEESFRISNKLTQKDLDELIVRSEGVRLAIEKQAQKLFDDRCISAPMGGQRSYWKRSYCNVSPI